MCARHSPGRWRCAVSGARRWVRPLGLAISFACLAWVISRFASDASWRTVLADTGHGRFFAHVAVGMTVYASGVLVLGFAWASLQRAFAATGFSARPVSTYLVTQIGKYLPGNVAQYVGRHLLLRRAGLGHVPLLACAFAETLSLGVAACLFAARFAGRWAPAFSAPLVASLAIVIFAGTILAASVVHRRWPWLSSRLPVLEPGWLVAALALHLLFFVLMGTTLLCIAMTTVAAQDRLAALPAMAAVAATSWMAGYVVPGAPAGLGVREAVLIALMAQLQPGADGLVLAAGFRVATFGGDVLAFMLAWTWRWKQGA